MASNVQIDLTMGNTSTFEELLERSSRDLESIQKSLPRDELTLLRDLVGQLLSLAQKHSGRHSKLGFLCQTVHLLNRRK